MKKRLLIFIVSYNAEDFIADVIRRIPQDVWTNPHFEVECLIIDDQSSDKTISKALTFINQWPDHKFTVLQNPKNQGYGGNQKIGYHYAIEKAFHAVLLLHGDGQYPPEMIESMVLPIFSNEVDMVLGSRMLHKQDARKGGMPLHKWVANQVLTTLQNWLLGSKLAEFHTGFRAFSVPALASVPFAQNSNYFDFDTDIIIQFLDTHKRILELPIPTHYGTEISRVNNIRYGWLILKTSMLSRLVPYGIFYHPKFDYYVDNSYYTLKTGFPSSHQFALDRVRQDSVVLDIGSGPGYMARELAKKHVRTFSLDAYVLPEARTYSYETIQANVEQFDFKSGPQKVDYIFLLDIIEHIKSPEALFDKLRECYGDEGPETIITTANVAFIVIRAGLLLGQFNYGKRGILDLDHARLFTFSSLRRLLSISGYEIIKVKGVPAPFPLALGNTWLARLLLRTNLILIRISRGMFSYQIAIVARPKPTLDHLLSHAQSWDMSTVGKK